MSAVDVINISIIIKKIHAEHIFQTFVLYVSYHIIIYFAIEILIYFIQSDYKSSAFKTCIFSAILSSFKQYKLSATVKSLKMILVIVCT